MYKYIYITCILLIGYSCGSKSKQPNLSDILVDKPWTSVATYEDWNLDGEYVEYGDSCRKDDLWYFYKNGTFERKNGMLECSNANPNELFSEGTWKNDDNRILTLKDKADATEKSFKVYYYSETELELLEKRGNFPSGVYPLKLILQR